MVYTVNWLNVPLRNHSLTHSLTHYTADGCLITVGPTPGRTGGTPGQAGTQLVPTCASLRPTEAPPSCRLRAGSVLSSTRIGSEHRRRADPLLSAAGGGAAGKPIDRCPERPNNRPAEAARAVEPGCRLMPAAPRRESHDALHDSRSLSRPPPSSLLPPPPPPPYD